MVDLGGHGSYFYIIDCRGMDGGTGHSTENIDKGENSYRRISSLRFAYEATASVIADRYVY